VDQFRDNLEALKVMPKLTPEIMDKIEVILANKPQPPVSLYYHGLVSWIWSLWKSRSSLKESIKVGAVSKVFRICTLFWIFAPLNSYLK